MNARQRRGSADNKFITIAAVFLGISAAAVVLVVSNGPPPAKQVGNTEDGGGTGTETSSGGGTGTGTSSGGGGGTGTGTSSGGGAINSPAGNPRVDMVWKLDAFILATRQVWRRGYDNKTPVWNERSEAERSGLLQQRKRYEAMLRRNLLKSLDLWPLPLKDEQSLVMARVWVTIASLTTPEGDLALSHMKMAAEAELAEYKKDPAGYRKRLKKSR